MKQRNICAAVSLILLLAMTLSIPRKLERYRELAGANAHLVALQQTIVLTQLHVKEIQGKILETQAEIRRRLAQ